MIYRIYCSALISLDFVLLYGNCLFALTQCSGTDEWYIGSSDLYAAVTLTINIANVFQNFIFFCSKIIANRSEPEIVSEYVT